jgi:hypothetical protein
MVWTQRTRRWREAWQELTVLHREALLVLGLLMGGGLLGGGLWWIGREPYRAWQSERAMVEARSRLAEQNYRAALLAFRRATQLSPSDAAKWEEVALFLSELGAEEALTARQNLARLRPEDLQTRLAVVAEALRLGDTREARAQLALVADSARETLEYHRTAATLALVQGRVKELDFHLSALREAEPASGSARYNLAALRVRDADQTRAAEGARELQALLLEPEWRVRAGLELLKSAQASRDPALLAVRKQQVGRALGASPADSAAGLSASDWPEGWSELGRALQRAALHSNAADVALVARWWAELSEPRWALAWLEALPPAMRSAPEPRAVVAQLAATEPDLSRLDQVLAEGAWGPIRRERLSLAMAARTQALTGARQRAQATWQDAADMAGATLGELKILARLAELWGEDDWLRTVLWRVAEQHPRELWALGGLRVQLKAKGDAEELWKIYTLWLAREAEDTAVQAAWLHLAALLDRGGSLREKVEADLRRDEVEGEPSGLKRRLALAAAAWRAGRIREADTDLALLTTAEAAEPEARLWWAAVAVQSGRAALCLALLEDLPESGLLDAERRLAQTLRSRARQAEQTAAAALGAEQEAGQGRDTP